MLTYLHFKEQIYSALENVINKSLTISFKSLSNHDFYIAANEDQILYLIQSRNERFLKSFYIKNLFKIEIKWLKWKFLDYIINFEARILHELKM